MNIDQLPTEIQDWLKKLLNSYDSKFNSLTIFPTTTPDFVELKLRQKEDMAIVGTYSFDMLFAFTCKPWNWTANAFKVEVHPDCLEVKVILQKTSEGK